jgi:hypothetical protein
VCNPLLPQLNTQAKKYLLTLPASGANAAGGADAADGAAADADAADKVGSKRATPAQSVVFTPQNLEVATMEEFFANAKKVKKQDQSAESLMNLITPLLPSIQAPPSNQAPTPRRRGAASGGGAAAAAGDDDDDDMPADMLVVLPTPAPATVENLFGRKGGLQAAMTKVGHRSLVPK